MKLLPLLFTLTLAGGCAAPVDDGLAIDLRVSPNPPKVGLAKVSLTLTDADGKPATGATLSLEGNMAHAGMKPVFAEAREESGGRYTADLEFTMGGDWFILVTGKLADGKVIRKKVDIKGVESRR
jgi:YtkA-like